MSYRLIIACVLCTASLAAAEPVEPAPASLAAPALAPVAPAALAPLAAPAAPAPPNKPLKANFEPAAQTYAEQLTAHQLPQMPATSALGVETSEVHRPGTMADFGAELVNSFNQDSTIKTGIALELTPVRMLWTDSFTAEEWVTKKVEIPARILDSVAISFATAEGKVTNTQDQTKTAPRSAVGIRFDLWNGRDLRLDNEYYECNKDALAAVQDKIDKTPVPGENPHRVIVSASAQADAKQRIAACATDPDGLIVEVSGTLVTTGEPATGESMFNSGRVWLTASYARNAMEYIVQGDFQDRKEDRTRRDWFFGGRIDRMLSAPVSLDIGGEISFAETNANVSADRDRRLRFGFTVDHKFDSGFILSVGAQGGTDLSSELAFGVLTKLSFVLDGKSSDLFSAHHDFFK